MSHVKMGDYIPKKAAPMGHYVHTNTEEKFQVSEEVMSACCDYLEMYFDVNREILREIVHELLSITWCVGRERD